MYFPKIGVFSKLHKEKKKQNKYVFQLIKEIKIRFKLWRALIQ